MKDRSALEGLETDGGIEVVGRDPRRMSPEDFQKLGFEKKPILDVLRARCVECCGGSLSEVRKCIAATCPSWPYRMGTDPFRVRREIGDEERDVMRERVRVARERKGRG